MIEWLQQHWRDVLFWLVILLLLLALLASLFTPPGGRKGFGSGGQSETAGGGGSSASSRTDSSVSQQNSSARAEAARRAAEAAARARDQQVQEVLSGDPVVAQALLDLVGMSGNGTPRSVAGQQDLIRRISQQISDDSLTVLRHAASSNDQLEAIKLRATDRRDEVSWVTDDTEVTPLQSMDEIHRVLPEQLAGDDEMFYANLADGRLNVERYYESRTEVRQLVVLVDVSGSMDRAMQDGTMRYQWAAGVTAKLMLRALDGGAQYIVRFFDGTPGPAHVVKTKQDARAMLDRLYRLRDSGGGTDIQYALDVALGDINTAEEVDASDVMLITDGDSHLDEQWVTSHFGKGNSIGLHLASIGATNDLLAGIANSHERYY